MALGIYSTVDPRHASVSFMPQYIFFSLLILITACNTNAEPPPPPTQSHHYLFCFSLPLLLPLPVCLNILCFVPFLWHLNCEDKQSQACQNEMLQQRQDYE